MSRTSGRSIDRDVTLDCDAVVVGSGAGGAVIAATLAEAGKRVIVLEEGPALDARAHGRMRQSESLRSVWRDAGMTIAVGIGDSPSINVTTARVLGGSSMVTGGVCFRADAEVLDGWSKELTIDDLSASSMDRWYTEVERDVHVETTPINLRSKSTNLFIEGGEKLGIPFHPMSRNTNGCTGHGRCNFGCPNAAKMSVDLNYLPRAERAGAELWTDCLVERVVTEGTRATGVRGRFVNEKKELTKFHFTVFAKRVILAGGAAYTPLILQASGLARRSGALGRNLSLHPSFRVMAEFDEPVHGWDGAMQSAYSDHFHDDGMVFNAIFTPPGIVAAAMPGFGSHHARFRERIANIAMFGGMLHDDGGGRLWRFFGREPLMTYRMSQRDRARMPLLLRRMAEIFFSAGAKRVFLPIFGSEPIEADALPNAPLESTHGRHFECSSQHPLGTCRMGSDPRASVVSPTGELWDVKNVYVADGSILPTSLGKNPQLTIMAMSKRVANRLVD